ncbi:MAG: trypsin-like peptidase domain-containing protein [Clostridia bacterium]|nr:trypsin-like peptidase domain-containing protein [Clostridia bacterium]
MRKSLFIMRKLSLVLVLLHPVVLSGQSAKDLVCVVRQQFTSETSEWYKQAESDLTEKSYSRYARQMESFEKDSFGSGFVYVAKSGKNYVLTNCHVVSTGEFASVEFEDDEGESKIYKDLKVVYIADNLDLALLEFPEGEVPFTKGFTISGNKINDGDDVWSAGFPGLDNKPVWQFGKGVVTNSRAKISDLIDPSVSTVIQHSAQVSSGNSGGPLLKKLESGDYEVVGINTWKATFREDTNFSIPASAIRSFMNKALKIQESETPELNDSVNELISSLKKSEVKPVDIKKFVSEKLERKFGASSFYESLRVSSTVWRNQIVSDFDYNPESGFATAVAWKVWADFTSDDFINSCTISEPVQSENDIYVVTLTLKTETKELHWKLDSDFGRKSWRLVNVKDKNFDEENKPSSKSGTVKKSANKGKKRSTTSEKPYIIGAYAALLPNSTNYSDPFSYGLSVRYNAWKNVSFRFDMSYMKSAVIDDVLFYEPFNLSGGYKPYRTNLGITDSISSLMFFEACVLQIPIPIGDMFNLTPYAGLGPIQVWSPVDNNLLSGVGGVAGGTLSFTKQKIKYSLFVEYYRSTVPRLYKGNGKDLDECDKNNLTFGIGIGF